MSLFKKKPVYVSRKGKYYNVKSNEVRETLTKKEKETSIIINLADTKQHLTKYDKKSKYKYKTLKEKEEYGISTNEVDILYMIDYLYLINNLEYKNIILRTDYFSIVLINNISVEFIEHSKEEGENLQFFSMVFNNEQFIHANLWDLYDKIVNDKSENNLISFVFLGLLVAGVYYGVFAEEEEEEIILAETSYVIRDDIMKQNMLKAKKKKEYKLDTEEELTLLKKFRQRKFINQIIDFGQDKKVENMFKMISDIKIDNVNQKYTITIYSLLPDVGYKRTGKMFKTVIGMDDYEKDKEYKNTLNKEIKENKEDYEDFLNKDEKISENIYTRRITQYLKENEYEYRLQKLRPKLYEEEMKIGLNGLNEEIKINTLKREYGFATQEVKKGSTTIKVEKSIEADKLFSLLRYLRDTNVLVKKLKVKKAKKTINSTIFEIKCEIEIIKKDKK